MKDMMGTFAAQVNFLLSQGTTPDEIQDLLDTVLLEWELAMGEDAYADEEVALDDDDIEEETWMDDL